MTSQTIHPLKLVLFIDEYAVCRLSAQEPIPAWAQIAPFCSITRTAEELSVLCPSTQVPKGARAERGWRLFKFQGPFEFSAVGILASVAGPLAAAGVSLLAIGTFDTDYILVKNEVLVKTRDVLQQAGHLIVDDKELLRDDAARAQGRG